LDPRVCKLCASALNWTFAEMRMHFAIARDLAIAICLAATFTVALKNPAISSVFGFTIGLVLCLISESRGK